MTADAFIHCRVTSEVKALVRRLAERDGINESTLVKQLLEVLLRTQALADLPASAMPDEVNRDSRLYVRLRYVQLLMIFPPLDLIRMADRSGRTSMISQLHTPRQALQFQDNPGVYHARTSTSIVELGISLSTQFLREHRSDPLIEWTLWADEMEAQVGTVYLADLGWDKIVPPEWPPEQL